MPINDKTKDYEKSVTTYTIASITSKKNKNGNTVYGVINSNREEIVPFKYLNYADAYLEWKRIGFSKTGNLTSEQIAAREKREIMLLAHDRLLQTGKIGQIEFYKGRVVNGSELVKLKDGQIGIAGALIKYEEERGNSIEIKDSIGKHYLFIDEPELHKGIGTPGIVICADNDNLYSATYNTSFAYVACYRQGDFKTVWKTKMYGDYLQSITVNDNYVIVYDQKKGRVKYLNKKDGIYIREKDIDTSTPSMIAHHNLAATNEKLLAGVPGLEAGLIYGLGEIDNELKVFDNETSQMTSNKKVPISLGMLNSLTIDKAAGRAFVSFDDYICVFDKNGFQGIFYVPTKLVHQLNFNDKCGTLLISMSYGKGKVEVYDRASINELISISRNIIEGNDEMKHIGQSKK